MSEEIVKDGPRFDSNEIKDRTNIALDERNVVYIPLGERIRVYKFRKVSGITQFTNFGEKDLSSNPKDFNQVLNVYNSADPVVIVWEDSTSLIVQEDDTIQKHVRVGSYYDCYWSKNSNTSEIENSELEIYNVNYNTEYLKKDITLESTTWECDMKDQLQYFYIIIDPRIASMQILELKSFTNQYDETKKVKNKDGQEISPFIKSDLTFESINIKYASSGKNILDFIQFGAIGEGYAFPKEENGWVLIDEDKLIGSEKDNNVSTQIDFLTPPFYAGSTILGRARNVFLNKDGGTYKFFVPKVKRLLIHKYLPPNMSKLFYNNYNSRSVIIGNTYPNITGVWSSYKERVKDNFVDYNILNSKEIRTGLDLTDAIKLNWFATNDDKPNRDSSLDWDTNGQKFNLKGFRFEYLKGATGVKKDDLDFSTSDVFVTLADFINLNSFANEWVDALNYDYKEITKYALKDVVGPLLGGIVNVLVGGLDLGWTQSNALKTFTNVIHGITPNIVLYQKEIALSKTAPLTLDFLDDDKSKSMFPVSTNILSPYNFQLTDRFQDTSQVKPNRPQGQGGDGIWDTIYLGQTKYEDGTPINADGSKFELNPKTFKSLEPFENGFIIDRIILKAINNGDIRISAFDSSGESKYTLITKTVGKIKQDARLMTNIFNFNYYDEFNTIGQAKYPEQVDNDLPDNFFDGIAKLNLNAGTQLLDVNFNNWLTKNEELISLIDRIYTITARDDKWRIYSRVFTNPLAFQYKPFASCELQEKINGTWTKARAKKYRETFNSTTYTQNFDVPQTLEKMTSIRVNLELHSITRQLNLDVRGIEIGESRTYTFDLTSQNEIIPSSFKPNFPYSSNFFLEFVSGSFFTLSASPNGKGYKLGIEKTPLRIKVERNSNLSYTISTEQFSVTKIDDWTINNDFDDFQTKTIIGIWEQSKTDITPQLTRFGSIKFKARIKEIFLINDDFTI